MKSLIVLVVYFINKKMELTRTNLIMRKPDIPHMSKVKQVKKIISICILMILLKYRNASIKRPGRLLNFLNFWGASNRGGV